MRNKTIYTEEILYPKLYNEIKTISDVEGNFSPLFITSNLFGLTSYLANNKYYIKLGKSKKISTGLMLINVGSSGIGKTLSENLVLDPLRDLQEKHTNLKKAHTEFAKACSKYLDSDAYKEDVQELIEKEPEDGDKKKIKKQAIEQAKRAFTSQYFWSHYAQKNPCGFKEADFEFNTVPKSFPIYIESDFTTEAVAVDFAENPNKTLLINTSEYDVLIENLTKTGSGNPHTTMINYLDGKKGDIARKTIDRVTSSGFATITTSTTPKTFVNEILKTKLFTTGLGYRVFFCLDEVRPFKIKPAEVDDGNNQIDVLMMDFQSKIRRMIDILPTYSDDWIFTINDEDCIEYYNERMKNFIEEYKTLISDRLDDDDENSAYSRIDYNVKKTILTLHLMNHAFELEDGQFHFTNHEQEWYNIGIDSIKRGFDMYEVFADSIIRSVTGEVYNKNYSLTKLERKMLNTVEIGGVLDKKDFIMRCVEDGVSQAKVYEFIKDKKFNEYFNVEGFGIKQQFVRLR